MRVFGMELPSKVGAMFSHTEELGGCIAANRRHPPDRQRMSTAHEYGHFLTSRERAEVYLHSHFERVPRQERFADAFARSFLMPRSGLRRHLTGMLHARSAERAVVADLVILANLYFVSVEAMTRRLEELSLVGQGTWTRLETHGFKVGEARDLLGLRPSEASVPALPERYVILAVRAFHDAKLTEGELARFLRMSRVEARDAILQRNAPGRSSSARPGNLGSPSNLPGELEDQ
jgi:Zn-dependent peptidase ImmA (M78 family)